MGFVDSVLQRLDPRVRPAFTAALDSPLPVPVWQGRLVLVGHRAAGKTGLLPLLAAQLGAVGVDLDLELERTCGLALRQWVLEDPAGFRAAERRVFAGLPPRAVVAVGGGFLFHHADLLAGDTAVLVPVSYQTYCERLRADTQRPRLRPELPLDEELCVVFHEREAAHLAARTVPLAALVRALHQGKELRACTAS